MIVVRKICSALVAFLVIITVLIPSAVVAEGNDPVITKVVMPAKTVKVGESFTVTMNVKNDADLIAEYPAWVEMHRVPKAGEVDDWIFQVPFIKESNGVYVATETVNETMQSGEYEILAIYTYSSDTSKAQYYLYRNSNDDNKVLPDTRVTFVTDHTDATAPVISKVETKSMTVREGEKFFADVYATDDSGIPESDCGEVLVYRRPKTDSEVRIERKATLNKISNGKYRATFEVDENWPSGEYVFQYVLIRDIHGNRGDMTPYVEAGPNSFKDNDLFPQSTITVDTSCKDAVPPEIISTEAQTKVVRRGETYSIVFHVKDASGIREKDPGQAIMLSFEGEGPKTWKSAPLIKQSDNVYKATFVIDDNWLLQSYYLATVELTDRYDNMASIDPDVDPPTDNCPWTVIQIADKNADISKIEIDDPRTRAYQEYKAWREREDNPSNVTEPDVITTPVVFKDVPKSGKWYSEAVSYAAQKGYMTGTGDNNFDPNGKVTRAQIAQILYAAEGKPTSFGNASFADVPNNKWYSKAVIWAANSGIVSGYPDKTFRPNVEITREQMVAIMYKYTQMKGYDDAQNGDLSKFGDQNKISKYAIPGMKWAVGHGVISGTNKGIEPKGNATRAQVAVILQSYDKNVRKNK